MSVIAQYGFPLALSCFLLAFSVVTGFIAEMFLEVWVVSGHTQTKCNGHLSFWCNYWGTCLNAKLFYDMPSIILSVIVVAVCGFSDL